VILADLVPIVSMGMHIKIQTKIKLKIATITDRTKYWRYSSARDYEGMQGLIDVERFW